MIITFFGHSSIASYRMVGEIVKDIIRKNTSPSETISFYLGGYGDFDEICASACRELRIEHRSVELIYVTPYMDLRGQSRIKELLKNDLYDISVYPPLKGVPLRFAISKRNEWMARKSDLVIAYVKHNFGGAYKAVEFAKRNGKRIINVCNFVDTL